jgi:hypothetical protein
LGHNPYLVLVLVMGQVQCWTRLVLECLRYQELEVPKRDQHQMQQQDQGLLLNNVLPLPIV